MHRAFLVAAGILGSRIAGLIRLRAFAHFFGLQSDAADAFNAAFRIPNLLQNLFGEGALSASFIPVYARLVASGDREGARRVAGAVGALLGLTVALLVLAGVLAAPFLTAVIAPGFTGEKHALTTALVRILFPGAGLLALSAWCLGILNSHDRFLLSYAAPVVWNGAMIGTLLVFGPTSEAADLAILLAWGSAAGSALQLLIQVPSVLALVSGLRLRLDLASSHVRAVVRAFVPAFVGRGVVQLSAFVDTLIATLLPTGAVTGLANAQLLYTLPVSLFGLSVAAAELPERVTPVDGEWHHGTIFGGRFDVKLSDEEGRISINKAPDWMLRKVITNLALGGDLTWWNGTRFAKAPTRFGAVDVLLQRPAANELAVEWGTAAAPVRIRIPDDAIAIATLTPGTQLDGGRWLHAPAGITRAAVRIRETR